MCRHSFTRGLAASLMLVPAVFFANSASAEESAPTVRFAHTSSKGVVAAPQGLPAELTEKHIKLAEEEKKILEQIQALQKQDTQKRKAMIGPAGLKQPVVPGQAQITADKKLIAKQKKQIADLKSKNKKLSGVVKGRDTQISKLKSDLDSAKRRLVVAETEVERLVSRLNAQNRASLSAFVGEDAVKAAAPRRAPQPVAVKRPAPKAEPKVEADMPIVTGMKNKGNLHAGPGLGNSPLMSVSKGTRLTVETRSGDWYRVNTPTGSRAWVSADVVQFSSKQAPTKGSKSMMKVSGVDTSIEDEAFELIRRRTAD
jgi:hypothetical protein